MYKNHTVSVVMSTYNERASIRASIDNFLATGLVDEVVIVDNNAATGTREEVEKTDAILIHEPKQGYGNGYRAGLARATGDLLVMCEPDGTFREADIENLLAHIDHMDVVQGTRTHPAHILPGANMGPALRYGNILVAKIMQWSFIESAPNLDDCGCTFRLFTREAYETIRPSFRVTGSAFSMELTLLCLRAKLRMCQIPVTYGERAGVSSVTGSFPRACVLGTEMLILILQHRVRSLFTPVQKSG